MHLSLSLSLSLSVILSSSNESMIESCDSYTNLPFAIIDPCLLYLLFSIYLSSWTADPRLEQMSASAKTLIDLAHSLSNLRKMVEHSSWTRVWDVITSEDNGYVSCSAASSGSDYAL